MTREEAINKLIRIRQQQGDKSEAHEALGMAIDALAYQAELPEGLEEAACEYVEELEKKMEAETGSSFDDDVAYLLTRLFIAGAEWQKAKMMEKAVGGRYMKADGKAYVESWLLDIEPDSVKAGDEVRLIVIPEEK